MKKKKVDQLAYSQGQNRSYFEEFVKSKVKTENLFICIDINLL